MKYISALVIGLLAASAQAQTITSMSNFTWSPATLTVTAGTTITFTVTGNHHAREVTQATWNANGTTSNGGFDLLVGTHTLTLTIPGTYYYVCVPHVSMGMKGQIIVEASTGLSEENMASAAGMFPNPANTSVRITGGALAPGGTIRVFDLDGKNVLEADPASAKTIDVSALGMGTYVVMVNDATGAAILRERLVIAR